MTNCPKFTKIQKLFHEKFVALVEVQPIAKTQTVTMCECGGC